MTRLPFVFNRVFSRIAVIPFTEIDQDQSLENCILIDEELKRITGDLLKSVGVFLELASEFDVMYKDPLFRNITSQVKGNKLDVRSQFNYALLLYSTGKVCNYIIYM